MPDVMTTDDVTMTFGFREGKYSWLGRVEGLQPPDICMHRVAPGKVPI